MRLKILFAMCIFTIAVPAVSQVAPDVTATGLPLTLGIGYSDYSTDWNGRLQGGTLWADWNFRHAPGFLRGLSVEVEVRDLNYMRSSRQLNLRQDTASGGVIYAWRHYQKFAPYAKFLAGYGSMNFTSGSPGYSHDSRTMYIPGGGLQYRLHERIWMRGDYEYQFWPDFFRHQSLNPSGFTIGVSYDLQNHRD